MSEIGVAIIGSGAIALANHLPGLALSRDRARVVALCDNDPATLERAARQVPGARAYADWRDVIRDDAVDAVIIATPNFMHPPIAVAARRPREST
jgi:predicted dehydrogenase